MWIEAKKGIILFHLDAVEFFTFEKGGNVNAYVKDFPLPAVISVEEYEKLGIDDSSTWVAIESYTKLKVVARIKSILGIQRYEEVPFPYAEEAYKVHIDHAGATIVITKEIYDDLKSLLLTT